MWRWQLILVLGAFSLFSSEKEAFVTSQAYFSFLGVHCKLWTSLDCKETREGWETRWVAGLLL